MEHKDENAGPESDLRINFFRPHTSYMRKRVAYTCVLLVSWAFFTFGFQLLLAATQRNPAGDSPLTEITFIGFPLHYWFTGQFLIVWFIFLCLLFNLFVDHLTKAYRKRR